MRLKEIKPGMAVHCKNDDEKKALLEEAERLGYHWINSNKKPTDNIISGNSNKNFNKYCDDIEEIVKVMKNNPFFPKNLK